MTERTCNIKYWEHKMQLKVTTYIDIQNLGLLQFMLTFAVKQTQK